MRIALGLEYDGTAFRGWQTQPDRQTVQDAVESALAQIAGEPIATICAGRTDTGVHAIDQVVHFDTAVERPLTAWVRGVNRFLPAAAAIRWAQLVPAEFHARFSARRRTYTYWILNTPTRSPLAHARAAWIFRPLELAPMRLGAQHLLGRHDFTSFRSADCQAASPERNLDRLEIDRFGPNLRLTISANAFLHHMVRNVVGALVEVGLGRREPDWIAEVLAARDRARAAPTLAAAGLYLTRVEYDPRFNLPAPHAALPWFDADPNQDLWIDT